MDDDFSKGSVPDKWDGKASERIVDVLLENKVRINWII